MLHEIKVDRPDGVSVIPGITTGLSIEYDIIYNIILSHEIDFYLAGCRYEKFICQIYDIKFLGLHVKL